MKDTLRMYCKGKKDKFLEITELDDHVIIKIVNRKNISSVTIRKGSFPYIRKSVHHMGSGVRKLLKDTFVDI